MTRDTRAVSLTDNGEAMLGFARTILAAQVQAQSYFTGSAMRGRLRFGSTDDLAPTQLPGILRDVRQLYPQINLELTDLAQVSAVLGLPDLGDVDFPLLDNPRAVRGPVEALAKAIMTRPVQQQRIVRALSS